MSQIVYWAILIECKTLEKARNVQLTHIGIY
jgi:hypothetical protein